MNSLRWIIIFAAVALLAACTASNNAQTSSGTANSNLNATNHTPELKTFQVEIGHTYYKPESFTVYKGDTIRFEATAAPGTAAHNHGITIDEYGINQAVTATDKSNPVSVEFVADKAGAFRIWCKTCWDGPYGHGHPNIQATLTVLG